MFHFFCVNSNVNRRLIYVWNRVSSGREFPYVYYTQSMCYARILSPTTTTPPQFLYFTQKIKFSTHIQTTFVERERENKLFCLFVCVIFYFLVGCTIKIKMRFFYVCVYVFFGFFSLSLLNVGADLSNLCT